VNRVGIIGVDVQVVAEKLLEAPTASGRPEPFVIPIGKRLPYFFQRPITISEPRAMLHAWRIVRYALLDRDRPGMSFLAEFWKIAQIRTLPN